MNAQATAAARALPSLLAEMAMMITSQHANDSLEILIGELITDEELLDAFMRDPEGTLEHAGDWALPLSESELRSLRTPAYRLRDRVADELEERFAAAA
jgi:hypothetical protein